MDKMKQNKTFIIALVGIMAALAIALKFLQIQLPIFPEFLKIDFALFPALLCGFVVNPIVGAAVVLVTEGVHLIFTHTAGIGEMMDFIIGVSFVLEASFFYHTMGRNRKAAIIGLINGTVAITLVGALANYFISLPLYDAFLGFKLPMIIDMCQKIIPAIDTKIEVILYAFMPFNLLKGILVSIVLYIGYEIIEAVSKVKE